MEDKRKEDRRQDDRRHDPEAAHMKRVQALYALAMGGVVVLAGLVILVVSVLSESLDRRATIAGGGLVLLGLAASMPRVFLPLLSGIVRKIPWGRVAAEVPRELPRLVEDGDE